MVTLEESTAPLNFALRGGPKHYNYRTADPYDYSGLVAVWPDEQRAEIKALTSPTGKIRGCVIGQDIRNALREIGVKYVKFERAEPDGTLREIYAEI